MRSTFGRSRARVLTVRLAAALFAAAAMLLDPPTGLAAAGGGGHGSGSGGGGNSGGMPTGAAGEFIQLETHWIPGHRAGGRETLTAVTVRLQPNPLEPELACFAAPVLAEKFLIYFYENPLATVPPDNKTLFAQAQALLRIAKDVYGEGLLRGIDVLYGPQPVHHKVSERISKLCR